MSALLRLARQSGFLGWLPKGAKAWARGLVYSEAMYRSDWEAARQRVLTAARRAAAPATATPVCIVEDWMARHSYYEAACLELGVPYRLADITCDAWLESAARDDAAIHFVRPYVLSAPGRLVFEERTWLLSQVLKRNVFPGFDALWHYESKRRCFALLALRGIPHPRTWTFARRDAALDFVARAPLPLVFKTDVGSDAAGVRILHRRDEAEAVVEQSFGGGIAIGLPDRHDRLRGMVLLQEYLPDIVEWRVIRIGRSYFAYQKGKQGDFHSGSKIAHFVDPPRRLLEFAREATDRLGCDCLSLDVFEDRAGRLLVNEMHTYYGATELGGVFLHEGRPVELPYDTVELMVDGRAGRYLDEGGSWRFEAGDFARNAGCNLRVALAFERIGQPLATAP